MESLHQVTSNRFQLYQQKQAPYKICMDMIIHDPSALVWASL